MRSLEEIACRWHLTPDGPAFATASSLLQPVLDDEGRPAIVKLARVVEEVRGQRALVAWSGRGTVRARRHDGPALLLPRATGRSLIDLVGEGHDDEALDRIAVVARSLHAATLDGPDWVPLRRWFDTLAEVATRRGGDWTSAWRQAQGLLDDASASVPLHGDLHHGNILDFGDEQGTASHWRAIDPKGLHGDPAFDFAAALLNPDRQAPRDDPRWMRRRATRLGDRAGLDAMRLLAWTEAFASLSAAWALEAGRSPAVDFAWRATVRRARTMLEDDVDVYPSSPLS